MYNGCKFNHKCEQVDCYDFIPAESEVMEIKYNRFVLPNERNEMDTVYDNKILIREEDIEIIDSGDTYPGKRIQLLLPNSELNVTGMYKDLCYHGFYDPYNPSFIYHHSTPLKNFHKINEDLDGILEGMQTIAGKWYISLNLEVFSFCGETSPFSRNYIHTTGTEEFVSEEQFARFVQYNSQNCFAYDTKEEADSILESINTKNRALVPDIISSWSVNQF